MRPVVIIPAYQPGRALLDVVEGILRDQPDQTIIVVDDGSTGDSRKIFSELARYSCVDILRHAVNLGKGQALKTAFNHFLLNYQDNCVGVVTADADGQHLPEDIIMISNQLMNSSDLLWLGIRQFEGKVPVRSIIGNTLTRHVFRLLSGLRIKDTQTGLRGVPKAFLPDLLLCPSSGYDFELEMLLFAFRKKLKIGEVPITTVYLNNNESSHFNPLLDSFKIYFVFIRFSALSITSAMIDYMVFAIFFVNIHNVILSTIAARVFAGVFNFCGGKFWVFKSKGKQITEMGRYIILLVFLMLVSYGLITSMVNFLGLGVFISKVIAESVLFIFSFAVQNQFVYQQGEDG